MFLGHFAVPTLLKHFFPELEAAPLYASSLFPDVIDKSLQGMGLYVNGRTLAHSLFSLVTTTLLVRLFWGQRVAGSWALGYIGHLVGDSNGRLPWLYPFAAYNFCPSERNFWQKVHFGLTHWNPIEIVLVICAAFVISRTCWR